MHEARRQITAITEVGLNQGVLRLIEFVEAPFGGGMIQVRHALLGQSSHAIGNKHCQSLHYAPLLLRDAAGFEPKNSAGEGAIYGRLRFLAIYSEDGEGALSLAHPTPQ